VTKPARDDITSVEAPEVPAEEKLLVIELAAKTRPVEAEPVIDPGAALLTADEAAEETSEETLRPGIKNAAGAEVGEAQLEVGGISAT